MPEQINPAIWDEPEMRIAVAARDISTVYRRLRAYGARLREIGKLTGQSQSEVSEIIKGRQVIAYDVLERIADGLGIPRGYMGLAYADGMTLAYPEDDGCIGPEVDDEMISRRFLGMASLALLGSTVVGEAGGLRLLSGSTDSLGTLGKQDIGWIKAMTTRLWNLDLQHGGGAAFAAARGTAEQVVGALRGSPPNRDLQLAASGLCRIAAWSAFDAGHRRGFWQCHATALDLAQQAGDTAEIVKIVGDAGRAEILSGNHRAAAKLFELTTVRRSSDAVGWGLLGSAYVPNSPDSAKRALLLLQDAPGADTPAATSMIGHVSLDLGDYPTAVAAYTKVLPQRFGRLAVQETAPLAVAHLQAGEVAVGIRHAETALTLSEEVRSAQGADAMRRLGTVLATQKDSTAQDLARRVAALSAA